MRSWILLAVFLISSALHGQGTVIARVVDGTTGAPLPHATVVLNGSTRGTITNREGWFQATVQGPGDSLRITYIGYRPAVIGLNASLDGSDIPLERTTYQLAEAVVRPGEDLYRRVVAASNWLRRAPEVKAKLYFGLETHSDEQPVEVLNAYFNATFKSAVLRDLSFKQGTIGIASKDGRHFINYNTAGAFALMDIHSPGQYFPLSPFPFTDARLLRRYYLVELVRSGSGPDAVDHLRATPREASNGAFTVDLWLAAGRVQVLAFELQCAACPKHPFIPLFDHGRIDSVDMRYRQTWSSAGRPYPEVTELEYHVTYTGPGFTERFRTEAIMHTFDRGRHFLPTLFPWRKGLEEYPMISWLPPDSAFWHRMTPPIPTERQKRDRDFVMRHDVARNSWYDSLRLHHHHLRPHYVAWDPIRTLDSTYLFGAPRTGGNSPLKPSSLHLRSHLYLDLDTVGNQLHHRSLAVFDGGASWYSTGHWYRVDEVMVTLFLDLCEMERRAMEDRLAGPNMTLEKARRIHADHTQRMKDTQERFLTAVTMNPYNIMAWNSKVRDSLGMDRMHEMIFSRPAIAPQAFPPFVIQGTGTR